jgi:LmbE family N-acetylglucosaminyl deacetylase
VLRLQLKTDRAPRILLIGAHSDDIEIGCGGTVLTLLQQYPESDVAWIVATARGDRESEARRSADAFLRSAGCRDVRVWGFRDGFLPTESAAVKEQFEALKELEPDVIFTHRLEDRHQDHRLLAELTWNTFRDHVVLEYEIPKYEGDLGHPNLYVPLSAEVGQAKINLLMTMFATQRSKRWFKESVFAGLMHVRGLEAGLDGGYAEGFYARKLLLTNR